MYRRNDPVALHLDFKTYLILSLRKKKKESEIMCNCITFKGPPFPNKKKKKKNLR